MTRRARVCAALVTLPLVLLGVATPASATTTYADTDYVALGDSYSSGVGAPDQAGLCLRSRYGYPGQWAARNRPRTFTNLSCGGAVTSDVVNLQVPFLSPAADLITITIGGNDAGFAPIVLTCQIASDADCAATVARARADLMATLPAKLDRTYAAIRRKAPDARIVVLGYPLLFDTSSTACGIAGMSLAKRRVMNQGADDLDELIRERARAAGFTYSDPRDDFAGHGICASTPYLNGLTAAPPQNSFHPNRAGYTYGYLPAMARALAAG